MIQEIEVLGKFATNDYNLLHWSADVMVSCEQKEQTMPYFKKTQFEDIKSELNAVELDLELMFVQLSWNFFSNKLENLMAKHIPVRSFKEGQKKRNCETSQSKIYDVSSLQQY